jgi:uncharacterized protein YciU (UPF0263 family)
MSMILRTFPNHLASNVPRDSTIQVQFMIDLAVDCVTPSNVILFNLDEQKKEQIELSYSNRTLTIQPTNFLNPLVHYQVELTDGPNGIRDITGKWLDQVYVFEFYAADVVGLKSPAILSPNDLSVVGGALLFKWEAVDKAYFYELEISKSNTFDVLLWPLKSGDRVFGTSITPNLNWEEGTYYARVRCVNTEGTKSAYSSSIRFHYQIAGSLIDAIKDQLSSPPTIQPKVSVVTSNPIDGSIHVPKDKLNNALLMNKKIVVEFSEDIDPNSIDSTLFYLVAQKN